LNANIPVSGHRIDIDGVVQDDGWSYLILQFQVRHGAIAGGHADEASLPTAVMGHER
jgi:hypothetical protein